MEHLMGREEEKAIRAEPNLISNTYTVEKKF